MSDEAQAYPVQAARALGTLLMGTALLHVSVRMAVVRIGVMRMRVGHGFMTVAMRVLSLNQAGVAVLVMCVMRMGMVVLQHFMPVGVAVVLGQVQPDAQAHQA